MPEPVTQEAEKKEPEPSNQEETVAIPKKELERLQKQAKLGDISAWDRRISEKTAKEAADLRAELASLREQIEALPKDDAERVELAKQIAKGQRELAESRRQIEEDKRQSHLKARAFEWAEKYSLDPSIFAECETVEQVELKAEREHNKKLEAERTMPDPKKLDKGTSDRGKGKGIKPSIEEFRKASAEEALKKIESGEWVLR